MEFAEVLRLRQSTRKYLPGQISDDQLQTLLEAANRAPVGSRLYKDIHLTVVQNQEILIKLCEAAWERFSHRQKVEEIAGDVLDKAERSKQNRNNLSTMPRQSSLSRIGSRRSSRGSNGRMSLLS